MPSTDVSHQVTGQRCSPSRKTGRRHFCILSGDNTCISECRVLSVPDDCTTNAVVLMLILNRLKENGSNALCTTGMEGESYERQIGASARKGPSLPARTTRRITVVQLMKQTGMGRCSREYIAEYTHLQYRWYGEARGIRNHAQASSLQDKNPKNARRNACAKCAKNVQTAVNGKTRKTDALLIMKKLAPAYGQQAKSPCWLLRGKESTPTGWL